MNQMTLKAVLDRRVINPATGRVLATDGERAQLTSYWRRRLQDGDVVEVSPPPVATPPATTRPAEPRPTVKKDEK